MTRPRAGWVVPLLFLAGLVPRITSPPPAMDGDAHAPARARLGAWDALGRLGGLRLRPARECMDLSETARGARAPVRTPR